MTENSNNNREKTHDQQSIYSSGHLWQVLGCVSVVVILCVGLGSTAVGAGIPVPASIENGQIQEQESSPSNTLTIRSTSEKRASYSVVVSGTIEPGPGTDLDNAEHPDAVSRSAAVGSVAGGGVDNFTFSGRITRLTLSGGSAKVYVNGEQVDPDTFPPTAQPTQSQTPTPSPTSIPTTMSTPTSMPTGIPTAVPTAIPTYAPTTTATPVPTSTATRLPRTSATSLSPPRTTAGSETSAPPSPRSSPSPLLPPQQSGGGGSGILGWLGSNLFFLSGFVVLVVFSVAALVIRSNRKPRF